MCKLVEDAGIVLLVLMVVVLSFGLIIASVEVFNVGGCSCGGSGDGGSGCTGCSVKTTVDTS